MEQTFVTEAYARLEREENGTADWTTIDEKAEFYGELKEHCRLKGFKPGWAAMKFKARFFIWPDDARIKNAPERAMSTPTLLWLKGEQMAFLKSKPRRRARK